MELDERLQRIERLLAALVRGTNFRYRNAYDGMSAADSLAASRRDQEYITSAIEGYASGTMEPP